jgi:tetratricopeptide (TPR) repeat protein
MQIVLVGRPEIFDDLAEALDMSIPTIHVDWRKNSRDIAHYVDSSIKKSRILSRAPKALREEIAETLTKNSQGMFIWVDLMLRELSKKTRPASIRESLHQAPKGLHEMLRHVLENFSSLLADEEADDLNTMLAHVTCAIRPLKLGELDTILRMKSPDGDGVLNLENMLRKQYASFFTLVRDDGLTTADLQGETGTLYKADSEEEEDGMVDTENVIDFDSNLHTTDVIFCHASIGDFFRDEREGKKSAGESGPAIGVNIVEARTLTLKTCLELVCNPTLGENSQYLVSLYPYAGLKWNSHLQDALEILPKIDPEETLSIGKLLVKTLRDEMVIEKWMAWRNQDFLKLDKAQLILRWLTDKTCFESLDKETQAWINLANENSAELFVPGAKLLARKWLHGLLWNPVVCMKMVLSVTKLLKGESVDNMPDRPPVDAIMDAAEWAGLEKTATWHRRLAMCLRELGHLEAALEHFESALKMESRMWLARTGMARIYWMQKKYEKAIELCKIDEGIVEKLMKDGQVRTPEDPDWYTPESLSWNCEFLGEVYLEIGELDNALAYFRKAFETNKRRYANLLNVFKILHLPDYHGNEEIMRQLTSMDENIEGMDVTRLTECLLENVWSDDPFAIFVASAAQATSELEWLRSAYKTAINVAKRQRKPVAAFALDICLAELYAKYDNKEDEAMRIWKKALAFPATASDDAHLQIAYCKTLVESSYSYRLFAKAVKAGEGTADANNSIKELDNLSKHTVGALENGPDVILANRSAMYMGAWHHLHGRHEEAKTYFQPYIKRCLMLLSNDTEDDDLQAYDVLSHVLVLAGDDASAVSLFQVFLNWKKGERDIWNENEEDERQEAEKEQPSRSGDGEPTEKQEVVGDEDDNAAAARETNTLSPKTEASENEEERRPGDPWLLNIEDGTAYWECDCCTRRWTSFANCNVCRYCCVDICINCLAGVKAGEIRDVCDPSHDWLHVPPSEQVAKPGQVLFEGKMISMKEFKDILGKRWS